MLNESHMLHGAGIFTCIHWVIFKGQILTGCSLLEGFGLLGVCVFLLPLYFSKGVPARTRNIWTIKVKLEKCSNGGL
jgi:hypothetical protein